MFPWRTRYPLSRCRQMRSIRAGCVERSPSAEITDVIWHLFKPDIADANDQVLILFSFQQPTFQESTQCWSISSAAWSAFHLTTVVICFVSSETMECKHIQHVCMYTYIYIYIYTYVCMYVYIYIYIYIYIHILLKWLLDYPMRRPAPRCTAEAIHPSGYRRHLP